jgi:hypothetical protein
MGYQPNEVDDTWADLIPEQPQTRDRLPIILAVGGVLFVLICLCSAAILVLGQDLIPGLDFLGQDSAEIPLEPTSDGEVEPVDTLTVVATSEITAQGTDEDIPMTDEPLPSASPTLAATVTLLAPTSEPVSDDQVFAARTDVAPTIDGLASEWASSQAFESSFIVFQDPSWDGSDDLTALWRFAWDDAFLYFLVEVADDIHVQTQSGNQLFRGDSVDIQFDTQLAADFGDNLSPDDHQITFSPGDFLSNPPSAWHFQGTEGGQILDAPGGHHVALQATQVSGGYLLEAAVPWSDLGLTPSSGLVIGMSLNANDNDTSGTAVQEIMKSHVPSRTLTDPSSWGSLTLQ